LQRNRFRIACWLILAKAIKCFFNYPLAKAKRQ
jgi:hypothetical protein